MNIQTQLSLLILLLMAGLGMYSGEVIRLFQVHELHHFYTFRSMIVQKNPHDLHEYFSPLLPTTEIQNLFSFHVDLRSSQTQEEVISTLTLTFDALWIPPLVRRSTSPWL
ncbi:MAG: hypothetical protein R3A11_03135 [Bdellovibrionota bacterium]